ncbi:hypothetical protein HYU06_05290 [Candidatus Woesearchaeota archaeon]|nr:hypothetical protein [Candidatus Woesearchaeota archaeon]
METGHCNDVTQMLEHLVKGDVTFTLLNTLLQNIGLSYVSECLTKRKLLTPKQLDEVVFDRFAPESRDTAAEYLITDGIAVIEQT